MKVRLIQILPVVVGAIIANIYFYRKEYRNKHRKESAVPTNPPPTHTTQSMTASREMLLTALEQAGYLNRVDPLMLPVVRDQILRTGDLFIPETNRAFTVDTAALVSFGVRDLVEKLLPYIKRFGVKPEAVDESDAEGGYVVSIDGVSYVMYTAEERTGNNSAALVFNRTLHLMNSLLEKRKAPERLYAIQNNGSTCCIFLTEEMCQCIAESDILSKEERPQYIS
jgi:hypothetical protein